MKQLLKAFNSLLGIKAVKNVSRQLFLSILLCTSFTVNAYAQAGSNDYSFNLLDMSTGLPNGPSGSVYSTNIQSDGKIIIAGNFSSYNGRTTGHMIRLNSDGFIDTSFNNKAINDDVFTTAIQSDGKILAGGWFKSPKKYIVRLNTDGSLDSSFKIGSGANTVVSNIAIQNDGKILVAGNFTSLNGTPIKSIARLNTDGSTDTSFNLGTHVNSISRIVVQSDGKVLIAGRLTYFNNGTPRNYIVRLNTDGTLDSSFYIGPKINVTALSSLTIQNDGKIIVGGLFNSFNTILRNNIVRLNSDGSVDTSFILSPEPNRMVKTTAVQSDGKIIVGGNFTNYNGSHVIRVNIDGSLDSSFMTGMSSGANYFVETISIQDDGRIIVGGDFTSYNGTGQNRLVRLIGCTVPGVAGIMDGNVCDEGMATLDAFSSTGTISWYSTAKGGHLLGTGGSFTTPNIDTITTYYVGVTNNSCSSVRTAVTANVNHVDNTVTIINNGTTISAKQANAIYRWLDCNNGNTPIPGELNQSYTPTQSGDYAVVVKFNGCSDTSACVSILTTGVKEMINDQHTFVYPNPNNGTFTIQSTEVDSYLIMNELGQTIQSFTLNNANHYSKTIENLGSGVYVVVSSDYTKHKVIVTK